MDNQVPKYVTQERASLLLRIPLGHTERPGNQKETFCHGLFEQ